MPPPCSIGAGLRPHGRQGRLRAMKLTVNGQERVLEGVDPDMPLLWGIRDLIGSQRNEIRLWKGALRRVHRALGWPACPLVSDISCRRRGWQGHDDRSDLRTRCGSGQGERGVKVIRLVRSEASAAKLAETLPGSPVFATEVGGWKERVSAAAQGTKIHVAIDSVGGRLLGDVADLLAERTGTVINFGSLGGEASDIRLFPPRSLTLKGAALGSWIQQPAEQRKADIGLALRLAQEASTLFEVAERYSPSRVADAVSHVSQAGRAGVVLIDFSKD